MLLDIPELTLGILETAGSRRGYQRRIKSSVKALENQMKNKIAGKQT